MIISGSVGSRLGSSFLRSQREEGRVWGVKVWREVSVNELGSE